MTRNVIARARETRKVIAQIEALRANDGAKREHEARVRAGVVKEADITLDPVQARDIEEQNGLIINNFFGKEERS